MKRLAMALFAAALAMAPAGAQDLDRVTVMEELIARPLQSGPAWWKVSDADSAIYILVELFNAPADLEWDRTVLRRRLTKANRMITPPDVSVNPLTFARTLVMLAQIQDARPASERLSPQGFQKLQRHAAEMGKSITRYQGWTSLFTAVDLEDDYFKHHGAPYGGLKRAIETEARNHRVRVQRAATIPVARWSFRRDQMVGDECLEVTVAMLELRLEATREASLAWAQGDVRPIVHPKPGVFVPPECDDNKGTNFRELKREVMAEQLRTLEQALRQPGHSVALLDPEELLMKDGILDRLRAKGYAVTTPDLIQD